MVGQSRPLSIYVSMRKQCEYRSRSNDGIATRLSLGKTMWSFEESSSSAPKLFIDLWNSSNHTQPYPTIADYYHHCRHLHHHYNIGWPTSNWSIITIPQIATRETDHEVFSWNRASVRSSFPRLFEEQFCAWNQQLIQKRTNQEALKGYKENHSVLSFIFLVSSLSFNCS